MSMTIHKELPNPAALKSQFPLSEKIPGVFSRPSRSTRRPPESNPHVLQIVTPAPPDTIAALSFAPPACIRRYMHDPREPQSFTSFASYQEKSPSMP